MITSRMASVCGKKGLPLSITASGSDENLPIILRLGSALICNTV